MCVRRREQFRKDMPTKIEWQAAVRISPFSKIACKYDKVSNLQKKKKVRAKDISDQYKEYNTCLKYLAVEIRREPLPCSCKPTPRSTGVTARMLQTKNDCV